MWNALGKWMIETQKKMGLGRELARGLSPHDALNPAGTAVADWMPQLSDTMSMSGRQVLWERVNQQFRTVMMFCDVS